MNNLKKIVAGALAWALLFPLLSNVKPALAEANSSDSNKTYSEFAVQNWNAPPNAVYTVPASQLPGGNDSFYLLENQSVKFDFQVPKGRYILYAEYSIDKPRVLDPLINLQINNTAYKATLPAIWADVTKDYPVDRYGNRLIPDQTAVELFAHQPFVNTAGYSKEAIVLELDEKVQNITLTAQQQNFIFKKLYLVSEEVLFKHTEFEKNNSNGTLYKDKPIIVEAENYSVKSHSYIRGESVQNPGMSPYNVSEKHINAINGNSWKAVGQKILWEFEVPKTASYKLGFKYSQSEASQKAVYRSLEIDGKNLFSEMEAMAFPQTPYNTYKNLDFGKENEAYEIYLEKGKHTIAMKAELGEYAKVHEKLLNIFEETNALGVELQKLAAGSHDKTRTWDMAVYMPEAVPALEKIQKSLLECYEELQKVLGVKPVFADSLIYASKKITALLKTPRTIPNNAELIHSGDDSIGKNISQVLSALLSQPLSLDYIYFYGEEAPPSPDTSFIVKVADWFQKLIYSFTKDYQGYQSTAKSTEDIKVWINRPVQYAEVLQQIIDRDYNTVNGTNIQLSLMPNEQKLILANVSKKNPDVVLGVNYYTPFEFALRGAAKNLLDYPDFLPEYAKNYNLESLVPLSYGEGVYGAVETQDFRVLFYRQDILDMLGLKVPVTWGDVKRMMPVLLRNSMNFGMPLAQTGAFKSYHETSPFMYQSGGQFYDDSGLGVAFNKASSMDGFREMTDFFNIYGAQITIANFYNSFRFSEIPIGIGTFSTYMQLVNAAPELAGRWKIALAPGVLLDDGTVLRYQTANSTACMIFENTKNASQSGKFLQWWLSEKTQLQYAFLLKSSYGDEYSWNTANLSAFKQMDFDEADKEVIIAQWSEQKENMRHPANYMVEREVSNIWNQAVINGKSLVDSVDRSTIRSNREITRKLKEFGYLDEEGKVNKNYITDTINRLKNNLGEKE